MYNYVTFTISSPVHIEHPPETMVDVENVYIVGYLHNLFPRSIKTPPRNHGGCRECIHSWDHRTGVFNMNWGWN